MTATNPTNQTTPANQTTATPAIDSSGFYRREGDTLICAPNTVHAPDYTLLRSDRARIALPKDGWDWFDSAEAAYAHHNLPLPQQGGPGPHGWPR